MQKKVKAMVRDLVPHGQTENNRESGVTVSHNRPNTAWWRNYRPRECEWSECLSEIARLAAAAVVSPSSSPELLSVTMTATPLLVDFT